MRSDPAARLALIASCLSIVSCWNDSSGLMPDGGFVPTEAAVLSVGSPGADEDPCLLRAADGSLYAAWFSHRAGNSDLYLSRWDDGGWGDPVRVTTDPDADFYPNLYQDDAGVFHIAWFRRRIQPPFYAYVLHNRSADGITWTAAGETRIGPTPPDTDTEDWVPTITGTPDGALHVYFVSRFRGAPNFAHEIFAARSTDGGQTWNQPAPADALNDPEQHDHLPFAARTSSGIAMAWVRHDRSAELPWENSTADLMVAESSDGELWGATRNVTDDDGLAALDLFPGLFTDHAGEPRIVWVTTRTGAPKVVTLPLAEVGSYPAGSVELPLAGYSPRVVATTIPGVFLGVWVAGPTGAQDVFYRFFTLEP